MSSQICGVKDAQSLTIVHQPQIKYLSPSPHGPVPFSDLMFQAPIRLSRSQAYPEHSPVLSYGRYFKGITDVISKDAFRLLIDATGRQLARDITLADIGEILIYAEKHGSDYHPARVEVMVGDVCTPFVMNVAATARGKAQLCREFDILKHLNGKYDFPFLPRAYFQGECSYDSEQDGETETSVLMFFAEWFQGYHEFHLSIDTKTDASRKLVVWDTDKGHRYLSRQQAWQIYSRAAKILTLYYDIETFEQVFPWHHAAGDFIVKGVEKSLDVRLVTARQYAPMLERSEGVSAYDALLFFLLNLSLRMRLDRLDGVGAVAWADDDCVYATLEGFVKGLRMKQGKEFVDAKFVNRFLQYLGSLSKEDVSDGFHALIDACDQSAPDIPVIRAHLERHVSKFHLVLQGIGDLQALTT